MDEKLQKIMHTLLEYEPEAYAELKGSDRYPNLRGTVFFYPFWAGTLLFVFVSGLPYSDKACEEKICAFHIHAGRSCSGTDEMPFTHAGSHYNPKDCPHPEHAGDLPPLFSNHGIAMQLLYTDRFTPQDVWHKTVIIHRNPDDFTTQPSGNAGEMIACGEIRR